MKKIKIELTQKETKELKKILKDYENTKEFLECLILFIISSPLFFTIIYKTIEKLFL